MNWTLRAATIDDLGFIFNTYKATMKAYIEAITEWDEFAQRQHYEATFSVKDFQIVQFDAEDVGVLSLLDLDTYTFLARIEILPDYQNRGLGSAILRWLIQDAKKHKKPIMLRVYKNNPAQHLYRRLGWQVVSQDDIQLDMLYGTVDD